MQKYITHEEKLYIKALYRADRSEANIRAERLKTIINALYCEKAITYDEALDLSRELNLTQFSFN